MDNSKRNFLIQNKVIGVLELKIDRLENQINHLDKTMTSVDDHLSKVEQEITTIKAEIHGLKQQSPQSETASDSNSKTDIKQLNQKLDILQGIAAIILFGIIINIFSKPLLTAFTLQ